MRLNRFVALSSGLSRRAADAAIVAKRVSVNQRPGRLTDQVTAADQVRLDGQPLTTPTRYTYVMFHKPVGYISSRVRQGRTPTLYELLPSDFHHLRTAGRLDRDSSGLIILTNDGDYLNQQIHPSFDKRKTYQVELQRPLTDGDRLALAEGVTLDDGPSRLVVDRASGKALTVSLSEGRNRQIRRTFAALGHRVVRLHRLSIGELTLGSLAPGRWRELSAKERPDA